MSTKIVVCVWKRLICKHFSYKVWSQQSDTFGPPWASCSETLNLFQVVPESNQLSLPLTSIRTYLLSRHPCWSQHFHPCSFTPFAWVKSWRGDWLWPLTSVQQLHQQDVQVSSWMEAKAASLPWRELSPSRYKTVQIKHGDTTGMRKCGKLNKTP